ncbi:MAG: RNA-binding cell elongation regulator Jag/EloR [Bacilli bacterium]|nr:RNA-binding cell elongation regulator Jag/EloR [Bacilli bacterium]
MKTYTFEGKTYEEALEKAIEELKTTEENLIIKILENKQGLLKKIVKIEVIDLNDVIDYLKDSIKEITELMNIKVNLEVRRREDTISITLFSDNNSILIGKNGKNIQAFQNIIRQMVPNSINEKYKIIIDVENYKEKRLITIERLAKKVAREVKNTKVEAKLDPMNSYERRIVHNVLTNNKFVFTESEGEEPNRYVVIKPKEEN